MKTNIVGLYEEMPISRYSFQYKIAWGCRRDPSSDDEGTRRQQTKRRRSQRFRVRPRGAWAGCGTPTDTRI